MDWYRLGECGSAGNIVLAAIFRGPAIHRSRAAVVIQMND
jgi:hypothetical protein